MRRQTKEESQNTVIAIVFSFALLAVACYFIEKHDIKHPTQIFAEQSDKTKVVKIDLALWVCTERANYEDYSVCTQYTKLPSARKPQSITGTLPPVTLSK